MSFSNWLDARDAQTLATAWTALGAKRIEVGRPAFSGIQPAGSARFAAAFLGWPLERLTWLAAEKDALPAPTFKVRRTVSHVFLEHAIDRRGECFEEWMIRELVDSERGVQHVTVSFIYDDGSREGAGGSATIVRVFDRKLRTAASIQNHSRELWTIGNADVDLVPLDLFNHMASFRLSWKYDADSMRAFLAQLAAEVDAHFDVSATWPGRTTDERVLENTEVLLREQLFEAGDHAIEFVEHHYRENGEPKGVSLRATLRGLPWGYEVWTRIHDKDGAVEGDVIFTLPLAQADALLARLASIPGVQMTR